MKYTPSEYLRSSRRELLDNMSPETADRLVAKLGDDKTVKLCNVLMIPSYVPTDIQRRMQKIWNEMVLRALFSRTSRSLTQEEHNRLAQKVKS